MSKDKKDIPVTGEKNVSDAVTETNISLSDSSQENAPKYNYTKAKASFDSKKTSYAVEAEKTVNELDEKEPIIVTTVKENKLSEKNKYSKIETTIENYNVSTGYTEKKVTYENNENYTGNGKLKNFEKTDSEYKQTESGARSEANGYKSSAKYGETNIVSGK